MVGGSNAGEVSPTSTRPEASLTIDVQFIGAAAVLALSSRVPTPLPWLRLDALAVSSKALPLLYNTDDAL